MKERMDSLKAALQNLEAEGINLASNAVDQLHRFADLVRHWNDYASLMSLGDVDKIETIHIPDALSLTKDILGALQKGAVWLDIGSGGGFPAIPIRIVAGELPLTLLERSEKKTSVVRQMLTALHVGEVRQIVGEFPGALLHPPQPVVITARAVEKAERLHLALSRWMQPGDVFLCQAIEPGASLNTPMFHVEQADDFWTQSGLRRGSLFRISRLAD